MDGAAKEAKVRLLYGILPRGCRGCMNGKRMDLPWEICERFIA